MKPIHKYNNGNGAMLCNGCRTIISTGPKTEEVLCEKCKDMKEGFISIFENKREKMKKEEYIQLIRAQEQIIKELKRSMSLCLMTGIAVGVLVTNLIYILLK
jgi:hypothetical protein